MFGINWLAVGGAALVQFAVGFAWYSPYLFGPAWLKLSDKTKDSMKNVGFGAMVGSFVAALVSSTVLAYVIGATGLTGFFSGAWLGGLLSLGLVATAALAGVLYEGQKPKLYLMAVSYDVVALALAGGVLALWN